MPEIPKHIERICFHCDHYEVKLKIFDGKIVRMETGPFCNFRQKPFPNPYGWAKNDGTKKSGKRTCKKWQEGSPGHSRDDRKDREK